MRYICNQDDVREDIFDYIEMFFSPRHRSQALYAAFKFMSDLLVFPANEIYVIEDLCIKVPRLNCHQNSLLFGSLGENIGVCQ